MWRATYPFSGAVYVFRAKRADRVKLIFWDGTGMCLFAKRLENGAFRWPNIQDGIMRLSAVQLSALLEGLDWRSRACDQDAAAGAAELSCGIVNHGHRDARYLSRPVIHSRDDSHGGRASRRSQHAEGDTAGGARSR